MKKKTKLLYILGAILFLLILILLFFYKPIFNKSSLQPYYLEPINNANPYSLDDISEYLDKIEQDPEHTKVVNLESLEIPDNFISSSMGVGNLNGRGDNIYLRFDRRIVGNESLENFKKYSNARMTAINIRLSGEAYISESDDAVRDNNKIVFTSYEDGVLTGILVTKPSRSIAFVGDNFDPECRIGDMLGVCFKETPIDLNLIVNFKVRVK